MRALRAEKTVSLDEAVRRKQRDEQESKHKARELAAGHATPELDPAAKTLQKIDKASTGSGLAHSVRTPVDASAGDKSADAVQKDAPVQDDGLQPDERSIQNDLKREKQAKDKRDVVLDEAAHIVADEIDLIRTDTKLAAQVLPHAAVQPAETD